MHPSASFSATVRVQLEDTPGSFARFAAAIGEAGGSLGAIDIVRVGRSTKTRDVTVLAADAAHLDDVVEAVRAVDGVEVQEVSDRTFLVHLGGKIEVVPPLAGEDARRPLDGLHAGRRARLAGDRRRPAQGLDADDKGHMVAVVTDGSAVLGLGDIGPEAALPVMEGKAMLFKEFGGVDAFPICLATRTPTRSSRPSRRSRPASAASTWRTSPPRAASRSSSGCATSSTSRSSTTTSTARRSSCWPRC